MSEGFVAIPLFLIVCVCSATENHPDLNPKLGKYQDASKQFPLTEPWYVVYRNFEVDPAFGTSKCVRYSEIPPEKDGGYPTLVQYGQNQTVNVLITLESSEGYTAKNQITFHPEGQNQSLTVTIAVEAYGECSVNRNTYVNEGACSVVVPESQLGKKTCCDFVYDLLCGTSKYQVYDDSCKNQDG